MQNKHNIQLAIIIPYYKISFFKETLASLAKQTDKKFNVYVGNDGSLESPIELLDVYSQEISIFYKKFEQNLGGESLVQQWNRCIEMVQDENWIMILGDDDTLEENCIEAFYNNLHKIEISSINVVRFVTYKIDENSNRTSSVYNHPEIEKSTDFIFRGTRSSLSEYIFRKEKVTKIGFKDFPLAWHSDVLAVLEFSDFNNVFTVNESAVNVRISELSISGSSKYYKEKSRATFLFNHYLLKNRNQFNEEQRKELFVRFNKCYLNDKKNIGFLFKSLIFYMRNLLIFDLCIYLKSIIYALK